MELLKAELAASKAELQATKTEVTALSAASGVGLPERLQRQESIDRTAAMLTLQAEADHSSANRGGADQQRAESAMDSMHQACGYEEERIRRKQREAAEAQLKIESDRESDLAIAARTIELKASIQDAIATTMAYLKGHLVQLRPNDKTFLNKAIASCAAGFELRLFREAHLTIKRAVLEVAGEQSRYVRRWLIPAGALAKISPHKQHELLKQIRLLVVAYDNMGADAKEKLTTAAEVLANLDVLIEVGQVCLEAEQARRQHAPRPLRPSHYGAHDIPLVVDGSLVPVDLGGQGSSSSSSSPNQPKTMNGFNGSDYYPHHEHHSDSHDYASSNGHTQQPQPQPHIHYSYVENNSPVQQQNGYSSPMKQQSPQQSNGHHQHQQHQLDDFADLASRELFHNDVTTPPKSQHVGFQPQVPPHQQYQQQAQQQRYHPEPQYQQQVKRVSDMGDPSLEKYKNKSTTSKVQMKLEERELASLQRKQMQRRRQADRKQGGAVTSLLSSAERRSIEMLGNDLPSYLTFRSSDALLERQAKAKAAKSQQAKSARGKAVRY
jgi:hypothetical protein